MKTFSSGDILDRLRIALSVNSDTELGKAIGVSKAAVSNWRNRNSIDLVKVFSFCEHINIDWLITGRGEMNLPQQSMSEPKNDDVVVDKLLSKITDQAEIIGEQRREIAELKRHLEKSAGIANIDSTAHAVG